MLPLNLIVSQYKDFITQYTVGRPSQMALVVRNLPASAGDMRDLSLISGSGRSPGGGRGNPLQYSRLENPMDRGAWRAAVQRIAELDRTEET